MYLNNNNKVWVIHTVFFKFIQLLLHQKPTMESQKKKLPCITLGKSDPAAESEANNQLAIVGSIDLSIYLAIYLIVKLAVWNGLDFLTTVLRTSIKQQATVWK